MTIDLSTTKVNYQHTADKKVALEWFKTLEDNYHIIACDFEVAIRYDEKTLDWVRSIAEDEKQDYIERKRASSILLATALDHPAHNSVTHLSIAWSEKDAYVIIMDNEAVHDAAMEFLVTTKLKQVWHRATFDFRYILYSTNRMPIDYEDSQLFAKVLLNHADIRKATTSIKELAGHKYGQWAISADNFTRDQMYEPKMLLYAATDACATLWAYHQMMAGTATDMDYIRSTAEEYSPWDQLPAPNPKTTEYPEAYFYHNTAKFLVRDTVRVMMNGVPISLEKVKELEDTLVDILEGVTRTLEGTPLVRRFLSAKHEALVELYKENTLKKLKTAEDYYVPFVPSNPVHRSYFMHFFAQRVGIPSPMETYPSQISKWSAKLVKKLSKAYPVLTSLVDKSISPSNPTAVKAMTLLAEHKATVHNAKYLMLVEEPPVPFPTFNPGSAKQKQEIFAFMGIESETTSALTGEDSWSREQIENVNETTEDEDLREFTKCLIDYSFAAIVKNNFIRAFYRYTVEGELHGQYNLLGAKSGIHTKKCHS